MSKRPVAFRVVRPGDEPGFTLYHDEALAASEAELCGGEYQGLYVRDGSSAPAQASWLPIEAAPMDTEILMGWWSTWPELFWETAAGLAGSTKGGWLHGNATHWMPLPFGPSLPSTDRRTDKP